MKGLSVVLILLVLVVGIAVRGSMAQPLTQATSAAYQQCVGKGSKDTNISTDRCRRTGPAVPEDHEVGAAELGIGGNDVAVGGVGAGADVTGGERWRDVLRAVLEALTRLLDILNVLQLIGGGLPQGTDMAAVDTLFDPVR